MARNKILFWKIGTLLASFRYMPTLVQLSMDGHGQAQLDGRGQRYCSEAVTPFGLPSPPTKTNIARLPDGTFDRIGIKLHFRPRCNPIPIHSRWRELPAAATLLWDRHADPGTVE